jgi:hypothetical protein
VLGVMHASFQGLRALAVTMILHSGVWDVPQGMRCPKDASTATDAAAAGSCCSIGGSSPRAACCCWILQLY